jgi:hypothetical protein
VDRGQRPAPSGFRRRSGDAWNYGGRGETVDEWFAHLGELVGRLEEAEAAIGRSRLRRVLSLDSSPQFSLASVGVFEEMSGRAGELGFDDVISHWPRPEGPYAGDEVSRRSRRPSAEGDVPRGVPEQHPTTDLKPSRRSPNLLAFIGTGAVLGFLVGAVIAGTGMFEEPGAGNPAYQYGASDGVGIVGLFMAAVFAIVAAVIAVLLDRRGQD